MGKEERFVRIYSQRTVWRTIEIFADTVTGVNYLYQTWGNTGGMSVLVDKDGKPVVSSPEEIKAMKR